uniref:tRNA (uracil(54)-C(5))-methyltransferase n=1 Tax=Homalodisca liturata TaxID=320908 RepID=A0A1B6J213_9HEMI
MSDVNVMDTTESESNERPEGTLNEVGDVDGDPEQDTATKPNLSDCSLQTKSSPNKNDPYAYIDRNGFTSEKFKIEIKGLPKFYGIGELKKLLNTKLKLGSNKIKPPKKRSNWVFVCFRSEEDREEALKVINGLKWKNVTLSAIVAKPAPDPLVKRRNEAQEEANKRLKVDDQRTQEEKVKDSTVPLWRLPREEQANQKTNNVKRIVRNIIYDIERQNKGLKTYFNTQRDNNEGAPLKMHPIVMDSQDTGYRNKCEFTIGINDETGEKTVGMRLGSYATGTVGVAPVYNLPHVPDRMKQAVKVFEGMVRASPLEVFNPETYSGHWRQLTVRLGMNTQQLMLIVGIHPQQLTQQEVVDFKQQLKEFFTSGEGQVLNVTSLYYQEITKRQSGAEQCLELVAGEDHISELLCGLRFNISPMSFFQVNTGAAELLYRAVGSLAQLTPQTTLVDVCCGTGSIGLSLAKDCGQVLGLELMEQAVVDARQNAVNNSITNCEFFSGPAEDILQSVVDRAKFDDVVAVVDPPRAGLRQNAVLMLRRTSKIKKIAYLACDLKSASKNLVDLARPASKTLSGAPFVPVAVTPVDMFPLTDHFEVIIYLERLVETQS